MQNFIETLKFLTTKNQNFVILKNDQIENVEKTNEFVEIVKKICFRKMFENNILTKMIKFKRSQ